MKTTIVDLFLFVGIIAATDLPAEGFDITSKCSQEISCLRKCCPAGHISLKENCTVSDKELTLVFHDENGTKLNSVDTNAYTFVYGKPACEETYLLRPDLYDGDVYYLLENGTLFVPSLKPRSHLQHEDFCVDHFVWEDYEINGTYPLLCFVEDGVYVSKGFIYVCYPFFIFISTIFLLATLFVYAVIPQLMNLHGKTLICQVSSLLCAYIFLSVTQVTTNTIDSIDSDICKAFALIIYFSFLASFFWLNVMAFDIWWTFSGFRPMTGPQSTKEKKKLLLYSLYAWGCPSLLLSVAVTIDVEPSIPASFIKPGFATESCWFAGTIPLAIYFLTPIAIIILINLILFGLTVWQLLKIKRSTAMLSEGGSQRHSRAEGAKDKDNQRFILYVKLFVVMGLTWVTEIISAAVGGSDYIWVVTDIANALQGVFIFVIFVCKKNVLRLLKQRCRQLRIVPNPVRNNRASEEKTLSRSGFSSESAATCTTEIRPESIALVSPRNSKQATE